MQFFSLLLLVPCSLHAYTVHALQKLVGMSTVSLLMSIAKHVQSSTEKAAQLYFDRDSLIHVQFMVGHILYRICGLDIASFPLCRVSIFIVLYAYMLHYSSVTWSKVTVSFCYQKICPVIY